MYILLIMIISILKCRVKNISSLIRFLKNQFQIKNDFFSFQINVLTIKKNEHTLCLLVDYFYSFFEHIRSKLSNHKNQREMFEYGD